MALPKKTHVRGFVVVQEDKLRCNDSLNEEQQGYLGRHIQCLVGDDITRLADKVLVHTNGTLPDASQDDSADTLLNPLDSSGV